MRILICSNQDLLSNMALNLLWPALEAHESDVVLSDGIGRNAPKAVQISAWAEHERRLTEDVLYPALERRPAADDRFRTFGQMAARTLSGTVRRFPSINHGEGLAYLERSRPDLIVSVRFGQLFKQPAIRVPRLGILNLHSGILPAYRGIQATFWSMLNRERAIGCTLHYVTDGSIDTGPVVGIHEVATQVDRSVLWNTAGLYEGGVAMIAAALARMAADQAVEATSQGEAGAGYYSYPGQSEMDLFLRSGGSLYTEGDYGEIFARRYGVEVDAPKPAR